MAWGPHLAHHLVLYGLQAKNGFSIFKRLKGAPKRVFHDLLKKKKDCVILKSVVFINKVLWEHSHTHSFMYYWPMLSYDENRVGAAAAAIRRTTKPKMFAVWPFVENVCRLQARGYLSHFCARTVLCTLCDMRWPVEWGLGVTSFDWLCLMSSSCELRGLFPLRFSGGSFPGLSQFPHTCVLIITCLKSQGGSRANLPFSPCTTLCFLVLCPVYLSHLDLLFLFWILLSLGRLLGATWDPPSPRHGLGLSSQWSGTELLSFVSQISGITALPFLTSASWNCCFVYFACGFVYCFVFSLFGARSKSAPCQPLLSRSRSLTLFWTPFSQWNYLAHEVLVLLNHFISMVFHLLSCLKQSEEAENSAALHVAQLFICSDLLFGIHGSWKECLDS